MTGLMRKPVLQLNRSCEPLRIVHAQHALKLVTKGKAVVVIHTNKTVCPGIYLPSVIRLVDYAKVPFKRPIASRKNIFTRDGYRCMYCGRHGKGGELELEHVVPKSRGGGSVWDNLVASCTPCNRRKSNRTPEEAGMKLIHRPIPATVHTPRFLLKSIGAEIEEWGRFLFNDSDGEQKLVARG